MTYYLLTYLAFSCPGFIGGVIPDTIKPMVCMQTSEAELIPSKKEAWKKAEALTLAGRSPRLYWCRGLKCSEKEISVNKSVTIK